MAISILGDVDLNFGELQEALLWRTSAQNVVNNHNNKMGLIFRNASDGLLWYHGMSEPMDKSVGFCRGVMRANLSQVIDTALDGEFIVEHDFGEDYTTNPRTKWELEGIVNAYNSGSVHSVLRYNIFIRNVYYLMDPNSPQVFKIRLKLIHRLYNDSGTLYSEQLLDEQIKDYNTAPYFGSAEYWEGEGFICTLHGDIMIDIPPMFSSVVYLKIEGVPSSAPLHLELSGYYEVQEVNTWLAP